MEYEKTNIVAQGLYDRLHFKGPTKLQYVETLGQLSEVTEVKLFMRLRNEDFPQALKQFKNKMKYELNLPPFHEYITKSGRYT